MRFSRRAVFLQTVQRGLTTPLQLSVKILCQVYLFTINYRGHLL